jgi:hypothetical protein
MMLSSQKKVYVQQHRTYQKLVADGFHNYHPIKRITMVRRLSAKDAPMMIETDGEMLTAEAGYWIAYVAGKDLKETLNDYEPRPIDPGVFAKTYRPWNQAKKNLSVTQAHLQQLGCQAYYNFSGVWAKQLTAEVLVQRMENEEPLLAPAGAWLCIGMEGEPWSVTEAWFREHYFPPL